MRNTKKEIKYTERNKLFSILLGSFIVISSFVNYNVGQTLTIKDAINYGINNYGVVKAKAAYAQAYKEKIAQTKREYLPNLNLSAQQSYGTVNGQSGPLYGLGGLGVASSGPILPNQNWTATFGALYLANVNWEFFNFGRTKQNINIAKAQAAIFRKDYEQELFQHEIKIAATYLNLLVSQRVLISQQKNLERAQTFQRNVAARVRNGLSPSVDSLQSSAEVSRAKITLNQIKEQVMIQNNELAQLMGIEPRYFETDTVLINKAPNVLAETGTEKDSLNHPVRQFYMSRMLQSKEQEKLIKKEYYPSFSLFGVYQTRASGFNSNYATDQTSYTQNYLDGISPTRQNYLFGIGAVWNLTSISRSSKKLDYQKLISKGLEDEYKAADLELRAKEDAANARLRYAFLNFNEAPVQVKAAYQAYIQRFTLYNNGLTTLTDVTTSLLTLNRAETDRDVAFTNLWQALLMKAAAAGNFNLFINEL